MAGHPIFVHADPPDPTTLILLTGTNLEDMKEIINEE